MLPSRRNCVPIRVYTLHHFSEHALFVHKQPLGLVAEHLGHKSESRADLESVLASCPKASDFSDTQNNLGRATIANHYSIPS